MYVWSCRTLLKHTSAGPHAFESETYSVLYVVFKSICPNQSIASFVVNCNGATGDAE
jgi:hypothetical protein